ncbi:MAG: divalent-cation tolerance protein CutA [Steroidobacteraceae bacterium]
MADEEVLLVVVSCPDGETAARLATTLVKEGLAACVNQLPDVTSTYLWEGQLQTTTECLLLAKTARARLATLARRVHDLHPYELPEVIALPVCGGSQRYLDWVRQSVSPA